MKIKGERNYKIILGLSNGIFKKAKKYYVVSYERIPKENGLILVMNHRDYWDTPLVFSIMGTRPVHVIAKIELKNEFVGKLLSLMGTVFVDKTCEKSRAAAKNELISIVQNGGNILIAPEGTRNKTESLLLPFAGKSAVSIAQKTGRPIIAFAISKCGVKEQQRCIRICSPFYVGLEENLDTANDRLREHLYCALLENESERRKPDEHRC